MEDSIKQLALISSVLGGFSFTFLSAILSLQTPKRTKFWVITALMVASMCFLLAALGWSFLDLNKVGGSPESLQAHHQTLVKVLLLGLISIMAALGSSGWLHEKKTGIATTVISGLALLFLVFGILSRYIRF